MMANYKGYADNPAFRPEQIAKGLEQIDRQTARMVAALQEEKNAAIRSRQDVSQGMAQAAQIQSQQLTRDQQIAVGNQKTILDAATQERRRALEEYNVQSEAGRQIFNAFAKMSETAMVNLQKLQREKYIEEWQNETADVIRLGENHPAVKQFRAAAASQQIEVTKAQGEAAKAQLQGARESEVAQALGNFQDLSPGVQMGLMYLSKGRYGAFIRDYKGDITLTRSNGTVETFKASEAGRDPERQQAVISKLMPLFLKSEGYEGINPGMLWASGLLPAMVRDNETMLNQAERNYTQDRTAQIESKTIQNILATAQTGDVAQLSRAIEEGRRTLAPLIGQTAYNKKVDDLASLTDENGDPLIEAQLLINASTGPQGEPMGIQRQSQLLRTQRLLEIQKSREAEAAIEAKVNTWLRENISTIEQQFADAQGDEADAVVHASAQQALSELGYIGPHPKITELYKNQRTQNKILEQQRADDAKATQTITPALINATQDREIRENLRQAYAKQQGISLGPDYESTKKVLENLAKTHAGVDPSATNLTVGADQVNIALNEAFAQKFRMYTGPGGRFQGNEGAARQEIIRELQRELVENDPGSLFYKKPNTPNNIPEFPNINRRNLNRQANLNFQLDLIKQAGSTRDPNKVYTVLSDQLKSQLPSLRDQLVAGQVISYPPQIRKAAEKNILNTQPSAILTKLLRMNNLETYKPPNPAVTRVEANPTYLNQYVNTEQRSLTRTERVIVEASSNPQEGLTNSLRRSISSGSDFTPTGNGKERTIQVGRHLLSRGYVAWQHPNFDADRGFVPEGGARVGRRTYNSPHHHQEALDFPIGDNGEAKLDQLYNYLNARRQQYGINQLLWRVKDHYDHLHVDFHQGVTGAPSQPTTTQTPTTQPANREAPRNVGYQNVDPFKAIPASRPPDPTAVNAEQWFKTSVKGVYNLAKSLDADRREGVFNLLLSTANTVSNLKSAQAKQTFLGAASAYIDNVWAGKLWDAFLKYFK